MGQALEQTMTVEQRLAVVMAENEALRAQAIANKPKPKALRLKIGQSGGMSVYGLGRFPVTLYKEQWVRLIGAMDEIKSFLKANDKELKTKE